MSFAVISVKKIKSGSVKDMQAHVNREKDTYVNTKIDITKSYLNVSLVGCTDFLVAARKQAEKREQAHKKLRYDASLLVDFVVTSDNDFFKQLSHAQQLQFFNDSLLFLKRRYGKENIISAVIHYDESTPHMHVDISPLNEMNGQFSASKMLTRKELFSLHTEYADAVKKYGLTRGNKTEDIHERKKHLSTLEYNLRQEEELLLKQYDEINAISTHSDSIFLNTDELKPQKDESKFLSRDDEKITERINARLEKYAIKIKSLEIKNKKLNEELHKLKIQAKYNNEINDEYNNMTLGLTYAQKVKIIEFANKCRLKNKEIEVQKQQEINKQQRKQQPINKEISKATQITQKTIEHKEASDSREEQEKIQMRMR